MTTYLNKATNSLYGIFPCEEVLTSFTFSTNIANMTSPQKTKDFTYLVLSNRTEFVFCHVLLFVVVFLIVPAKPTCRCLSSKHHHLRHHHHHHRFTTNTTIIITNTQNHDFLFQHASIARILLLLLVPGHMLFVLALCLLEVQ